MKPFRSQTVAEQLAAHFRREMEEGRLSGIMPGVLRLEAETGANRKTVEAAMQIMEREGLLLPQGVGKRRLIAARHDGGTGRGLRIGILLFDRGDVGVDYMLSMEHQLSEAGHTVFRAPETLTGLDMDPQKVARFVAEVGADAWAVIAASREVLEWFVGEGIPVIAVFGRRRGLPLAGVGPDKLHAYQETVRMLIALGHRRIVWLARRMRRLPSPGAPEQAFLDELDAHGIRSGPYNLPDWEETREGFQECLESLFRLTPPTAIVADEAQFYFAVRHFLAAKGLSVPGDVSVICTDDDRNFQWCTPSVARIRWDHRPLVRRVVKWADNVSKHRTDHVSTFIKSEFVPGGTIGPAKRGDGN